MLALQLIYLLLIMNLICYRTEVLEHINDPRKAVEEIHRVLKQGGYFYLQLPFIIGFHPCQMIIGALLIKMSQLLEHSNFKMSELKITVGPAVGLQILVEFLSLSFSLGIPIMYKPMKLIAAIFVGLLSY